MGNASDQGGNDGPTSGDARLWNGLCVAAVLVNATLESMLVPALPQVRASLDLSATESAWLFSSMLLVGAIALPIVGRLGDVLGSRRLVVAVLASVTAGVGVAGAATSFPMLLVGQMLQGPMFCLVPLALSLLREITAERPGSSASSAGIIAAASASTFIGMLLGGIVLDHLSYRLLFWATFACDIPLLAIAVKLSRAWPARSGASARIDWFGALLLAAGLLGLLLGLTLIEFRPAASLPVALVGLVALVAAFRWFVRARSPLLDPRLLRLPAVASAAIIQFGAGFGTFGMFVTIPMIVTAPPLEGGLGLGASATSFCLLPFGVAGFVSPAVIPLLHRWLSSGAILLIGSAVLILAPLLALSSMSLIGLGAAAALLGFGVGMVVTQSFDLLGLSLPPDHVASLGGFIYVLRMVGNAVGGLVSAILVSALPKPSFGWALAAAAIAMTIPTFASLSLWRNARVGRRL